jgi:hypothetical protein
MYRGSRKHVLDWTERLSFAEELVQLFPNIDIRLPPGPVYLPRGYNAPNEARLESFGPDWMPSPVWKALQCWWLLHERGANTPNWDIVLGCIIERRPGLVLVEAKANSNELQVAGKLCRPDASKKSRENHEQIGRAILEACSGLQRIDPRFSIGRDSHYQLANRLAFTWKLAMLGIPVVLCYLGFIGDEGIGDVGSPFRSDRDWHGAFAEHAEGVLPIDLLDQRIDLGPAHIWIMCRSRLVLEISPSREKALSE